MSSSISPAVILSLLLLFCNVNLIRADCLLCDGIRDDGMPENNWGYQLEDGRFCQDVFLKILDLDPWDDTW